jgi:hypothetical protein
MFQASSQQAAVPLTEDCSDSSAVLATISASAPVEVRSSMAGSDKPCYAVTAMVDGKPLRGYVHGNQLDAVGEYERQRAAAAASIAPVVPSTPATPPPASIPVERPHYPPFGDFSALDMKGKGVSVHSLKGKVILVCFWSPTSKASFADLLAAVRLYGQFKQHGVDALSVSLSGNSPALRDTLEDIRPGFRNIPNGLDIATRYNVYYENLPKTYVLNENFEVIASGLHGKAIEDLVKKLLAEK